MFSTIIRLAIMGIATVIISNLAEEKNRSQNTRSGGAGSRKRKSHKPFPRVPVRGGTAIHQVVNPEGELYTVDTINPSSPFYGADWDAVCRSLNERVPVNCRAFRPLCSRAHGFLGTLVTVGNVVGLLPACQIGVEENIPEGILITVRVTSIDPNRRHMMVGRI